MAGAINRQTALIGQTDRRCFVARGYPCKTSAPGQTQSTELAKLGDCLPSKAYLKYKYQIHKPTYGAAPSFVPTKHCHVRKMANDPCLRYRYGELADIKTCGSVMPVASGRQLSAQTGRRHSNKGAKLPLLEQPVL
jgi:hypothetical protein